MNQTDIVAAIKSKSNLLIRYDDDLLDRTFSPYILYTSKKGELTLGGYQVRNPAKPQDDGQWRAMHLNRIRSIRILNSRFIIDQSFDPSDDTFGNRVISHVKQYVA